MAAWAGVAVPLATELLGKDPSKSSCARVPVPFVVNRCSIDVCFVIWIFFNFQQKECFAAIVKNGSLLSNVGKMTWTRGLGPSPRSEPNQRVLGVQRS